MSFTYPYTKLKLKITPRDSKDSNSYVFQTLPSTPRITKSSPNKNGSKLKLGYNIFPKKNTYITSKSKPTSIPLSPRSRRATKAAVTLQKLLIDHPSSPSPDTSHESSQRRVDENVGNEKNTKGPLRSMGKKRKVLPRLREKDVTRLKEHLLDPDSAQRLLKTVKNLPLNLTDLKEPGPVPLFSAKTFQLDGVFIEKLRSKHASMPSMPNIAVCQDCIEQEANDLSSSKIFPKKPTLLSLLEPTSLHIFPSTITATTSILRSTLNIPTSTSEELSKHFDEVLRAERKVYELTGPSHLGLKVPIDRMSVMTYWWGFELALPPPSLRYLAHVKDVTQAVLELLSVLVYAVPGGARELAPFQGLLSRFVDAEWRTFVAQDRGNGVVCGATWFIPAAIVARPWDFESQFESKVSPISEIPVPTFVMVRNAKSPIRSFVVKRPGSKVPFRC